jgi:hypothetical protein
LLPLPQTSSGKKQRCLFLRKQRQLFPGQYYLCIL